MTARQKPVPSCTADQVQGAQSHGRRFGVHCILRRVADRRVVRFRGPQQYAELSSVGFTRRDLNKGFVLL